MSVLEPWGGTPEAVLFGRPHGDQLPPPCQQGAEFVGLGIRQGPGGRPHGLGKMGQGPRVEGICLGQLSGGFGKVTGLARIDHRHRQSGGGQRRHHGPLVAPRGFKDNQGGRHGLEALHQGSNPGVIVGHGPTFAGGPQGDIELGFGDIDTNKTRRGRHHYS